MDAFSARELADLLWKDREEPFYSVHPTLLRSPPMPREDALFRLERGDRFFCPVPRIASGNRKPDCAQTFNALWVDIDRDPSWPLDRLLDELQPAIALGLQPSAVVDSGNKGIHAYWLLREDLPIETIETVNVQLRDLLGGDNVHDRTRLMRVQGVHEKSGRPTRVVSITGQVYDVDDLSALGPIVEPIDPASDRRSEPFREAGEWLNAASALRGWEEHDVDPWAMLDKYTAYCHMDPSPKRGLKISGRTRSEIELSIVLSLVKQGASDRQIVTFADEHLPKHIERRANDCNAYIHRTINKARAMKYTDGWLTHPNGGWPRKREAKHRWATVDDLDAMLELVRGQPLTEWVAEIQTTTGRSRAAAYSYGRGLLDEGLIEKIDRRIFRLGAVS